MGMTSEDMGKAIESIVEERKREATVRHDNNNRMTKMFYEFDKSLGEMSKSQDISSGIALAASGKMDEVSKQVTELDFILRGVDRRNGLVSKVNKIEAAIDKIEENTSGLTVKITAIMTTLTVGSVLIGHFIF